MLRLRGHGETGTRTLTNGLMRPTASRDAPMSTGPLQRLQDAILPCGSAVACKTPVCDQRDWGSVMATRLGVSA